MKTALSSGPVIARNPEPSDGDEAIPIRRDESVRAEFRQPDPNPMPANAICVTKKEHFHSDRNESVFFRAVRRTIYKSTKRRQRTGSRSTHNPDRFPGGRSNQFLLGKAASRITAGLTWSPGTGHRSRSSCSRCLQMGAPIPGIAPLIRRCCNRRSRPDGPRPGTVLPSRRN